MSADNHSPHFPSDLEAITKFTDEAADDRQNNVIYPPQWFADSPMCIGLSPIEADHLSPKDVIFDGVHEAPLLVSTAALPWYSDTVIGRLSGGNPAYLYTHESADRTALDCIDSVLDTDGSLVLITTDGSSADFSDPLIDKLALNEKGLVTYEIPGVLTNQYVGTINVEGATGYKSVEDCVEVFNNSPELQPQEGETTYPALLDKIEDETELDRLWEVYHSRFEKVGAKSITEPAFTENEFKDLMRNPKVVKPVLMVDGKIANLSMFMTDLSQASWLNESYFAGQYPEAYEEKALTLFLGLVSDPDMGGGHKSLAPIHLMMQVAKKMDTNVLVTFECNEESIGVTPPLVTYAVNSSGVATMSGLEEPIASSHFIALQRPGSSLEAIQASDQDV